MNGGNPGWRLSRRSALTLLMAGGIGGLSVSRAGATAINVTPVHGIVYAVDASDGTEQWQKTADNVTGQPVVDDDTVYTISTREVRALDRESGESRWELDDGTPDAWRESDEQHPPRITVADGTVYVNAGTLYALEPDGNIHWEYDLTNAYSVAPVVAEGLVVACRNNTWNMEPNQYELIALDADSGNVVWSVERESRITTKPTVADGIVYVGDPSADSVDAYALETGELRDSDAPEAVANDQKASQSGSDGLQFTISETELEAHEDGEVVWSFDTDDIQDIEYGRTELRSRKWIVHEPVVDEETVYIGCIQWDETYTPPPEAPDMDDPDDLDSADDSETASNGDDSTHDESPLGVKPALAGIVGLGVLGRLLSNNE